MGDIKKICPKCGSDHIDIQLFKKKNYKGNAASVSQTKNKVAYKSFCVCKDCGNHWEV